MNNLVKVSLLTLLFTAHAFAGPSDGGGTNLVIQENELSDFVKARAELGKKQLQISPRSFKLPKSFDSVYESIDPMIYRAERLYPGLGKAMERAYSKPWMVVDAEFEGRKEGERKVISQTDDAVFVSLSWLKKASREQVAKAFFHEGVRNFAHEYVDKALLHKVEEHLEADDSVTEELTPALYNQLPATLLEEKMRKIHRQVGEYGVNKYKWVWAGPMPKIASREQLYSDFRAIDADRIVQKVCAPIFDDGYFQSWNISSARTEATDIIIKAKKEDAMRRYMLDADSPEYLYSANESAQAVLDIINLTLKPGKLSANQTKNLKELCHERKYKDFLVENMLDKGRAPLRNTTVDKLPELDEATDPAAQSAE